MVMIYELNMIHIIDTNLNFRSLIDQKELKNLEKYITSDSIIVDIILSIIFHLFG